MHEAEKLSLEAMGWRRGQRGNSFESDNHHQVYSWVERVLIPQEYARQDKAARGRGATLHREDDRIEPGAGDAADRSLHRHRPCPAYGLTAAAFC